MTAPRSRASRIVARIVIIGLVLSLPAEIALATKVGEPFPAFYQPEFPGAGVATPTTVVNTDTAEVVFADGRTSTFPMEKLPDNDGVSVPYLTTAFARVDTANAPDIVAWLKDRLAELYPGREAVQFIIHSTKRTYALETGKLLSEWHRPKVVVELR